MALRLARPIEGCLGGRHRGPRLVAKTAPQQRYENMRTIFRFRLAIDLIPKTLPRFQMCRETGVISGAGRALRGASFTLVEPRFPWGNVVKGFCAPVSSGFPRRMDGAIFALSDRMSDDGYHGALMA